MTSRLKPETEKKHTICSWVPPKKVHYELKVKGEMRRGVELFDIGAIWNTFVYF